MAQVWYNSDYEWSSSIIIVNSRVVRERKLYLGFATSFGQYFVNLFLRLKNILHHFSFFIFFEEIVCANFRIYLLLTQVWNVIGLLPQTQHSLFWQVWARRRLTVIANATVIARKSFTAFFFFLINSIPYARSLICLVLVCVLFSCRTRKFACSVMTCYDSRNM